MRTPLKLTLILVGLLTLGGCMLESAAQITATPLPTVVVPTQPAATAIPPTEAPTTTADDPGREAFMAFDATTLPALATLIQQVAEAAASGEAWVQDPKELAMRLAGYDPAAPDQFQGQVLEVERTDTTAVYLVTQESLPDDSLRGQQVRVELAFDGSVWQVHWVGMRWKCQEGRGQQDWAPQLCA